MPFAAIILLSVFSAVLFGILHNQITVRICEEFYTVAHRPIPGFDSPSLIALASGVLATWWMGILIGFLLACTARLGSWPQLSVTRVAYRLGIFFITLITLTALSGLIGYQLATRQIIALGTTFADRIPTTSHNAFLTNLWIHSTSYLLSFLGSIILAVGILRRRWKLFQAKKVGRRV
jgi:hypothetical protein